MSPSNLTSPVRVVVSGVLIGGALALAAVGTGVRPGVPKDQGVGATYAIELAEANDHTVSFELSQMSSITPDALATLLARSHRPE